MWKATFTSLWSRKLRLSMSVVAIILGVAFVSGSFVFSDMIRGSFSGIINSTVPDVDVSKDSTASTEDGTAGTSKINQALVDQVRGVDGVSDAAGVITAAGVVVIDQHGKAIVSVGPPQLGFNWHTQPALAGATGPRLIEGHAPEADDQIVMDPDTLRKSGYSIGDRVKVITPTDGTIEVTVVGTGSFGDGSTAGATYLFFTTARAQALFLDGADSFTSIWVTTHADADRAAVAERIQQLLPEGYLAQDGQVLADEQQGIVASSMGFLDTFLLVFAGIALLVATFLIVNTFTILVAQRSKELALFRSMGASRGQIMSTVLVEALVLGVVGSVIGLFTGVGLAYLLKAGMSSVWDIGRVSVTLGPTAIIASLGTGLVVTLVASLGPARRATRIAPIEAMTSAQTEQEKGLGARAVVGVVLAVLGAVGILLGLFTDIPVPMAWAGAGMAAAMIGVAIASPLLGRPVVWLVGRLYRALFGEVGKLAELNSIRQPRRTAATASALMVGLTLVSTIAIFGQSATVSVTDQVENTVRGDYLVGQQGFTEFPAVVGDKVAAVDDVEAVHRMKMGLFMDGEEYLGVGGMDPESFDKLMTMSMVKGRNIAGPHEMLIEESVVTDEGWDIGTTKTWFSPEAQRTVTYTVVGIYSNGEGTNIFDKWVTTEGLQSMGLGASDVFLTIDLKPGVDPTAARTHLDAAVADMPLVSVMDTHEYTEQLLGNLAQVMGLLYGLLALSIVIAVLGIVNTLGLSIIERTREIGLLRAIALTRSQVRRMITLESVVIALLGAVVGVGLGTAFGVVLQRIIGAEQDVHLLSIPWDQLALFVVAAVVVGVLAAVWPAQRAARTDVLAAIAAE
ncbi:ABC transporter permease [Propionibacteriaceae bacterium Y1923]|uniref:ABC transporter permease n=1 Tax=Aestuariimicrobium sp. Y1814 TaxID=3418742 RepID=UPI003C236CD7